MRRRPRLLLLAGLAAGLLAIAAPAAAGAQAAGYQVVVHAANPTTAIARAELAKLFLRRTRAWPHKGAVEPIDQAESAPVRQAFSKDVLGKDAAQVKAFWQGQVFTGQGSPPAVKKGDAEVLAHVAASKGAIGYVAPGVALPDGVKPVVVKE